MNIIYKIFTVNLNFYKISRCKEKILNVNIMKKNKEK